ncbi:ABC transporter substrate-binding protein [Candidatus Daviesbacteria bacterium]|nr:ABC transporter substrate-binding protein [Candidatus Daviesbacteria bacterium]
MRNINFFLYLFFRYLKRHFRTLLLVIIVITVATGAFWYFKEKVFRKTITQGIVGTYTENDIPQAVTNLLSKGLVIMDDKGSPKANLVNNWQVSEDAKVYTFNLKKDLKWSDGNSVKSSQLGVAIEDVKITYPNDLTIKFELLDSFSPLPSLLTRPILKEGSLVGIGPYKVANLYKDPRNKVFINKIVLTNDDYSLPNVVIRFYPNEKIAKNALQMGEIQSLIAVNSTSDFNDQKPFTSWSKTNFQRIVAIFYNTQDEVLSDKNFRLALSYAAPKIKGETAAKTSIPQSSWAYNDEVREFLSKPKESDEALEKVKNGASSTITLTVTTNLKEVGEQVIKEWKKQGIKARLQVESGIPQNYQALLIAQNIPSDPDQYSLWHSTQSQTNISRYNSKTSNFSARVDKNLEDGRKITDQKERKLRYYDFQKILQDDAPATFLYFPKFNIVYLKKVEDSLNKILPLQFPELN